MGRLKGVVGVAAVLTLLSSSTASAAAPTITVVSNRADLVSAGDALVRITLPAKASKAKVRVVLGKKKSVSRQFTRVDATTLEGVVKGLKNGKNVLSVRIPGQTGAELTITNHPQGGPVFSGPQPHPWQCQKTAVDAQCNQPPTYAYVYKSTDSNKDGFQPYDPKNPPGDVATTTAQDGTTMPFVVRQEVGYLARDQYRVATLFDPAKPWTAMRPQEQFNHKLLITHGASCDVDYAVGNAPSVLSYNPADLIGLPIPIPGGVFADSVMSALGKGFAVMSTAHDNSGHNCDVVTQAESLVMAKEHVIDTYGTLRYTIGTGCSGGSLAQQWIANAYPGIYQGILPTCSFPDTWSSATQVMDYHLLRSYFESPSKWGPGVLWSPTQWGAVEGNLLPVDAIISDIGFFNAIVPTHGCGGTTDQNRYSQANISGIRCSVADLNINVLGPREESVWSDNEKRLGRGFAGVPVDNVGVQYGLQAVNTAQITPQQFVDLNERIGGLSIDIVPTAARISADRPALANAYRSGSINETNNMGDTAIIDCRGPDPGAAHDSYRAFAVRARLDRELGSHANQLIYEGAIPIVGDTRCNEISLNDMDRWLAAIEKDTSDKPLATKVVADKPKDLTDACFSGIGQRLLGGLCPDAIVPVYGTPRTVAGDAITTDANKCRLRPLNKADYLLPFSDAQWAQLQKIFPGGVCDFTKPGVDQQKTIPWMTYADSKGRVIYGGRAMRAAPRSKAVRVRRR